MALESLIYTALPFLSSPPSALLFLLPSIFLFLAISLHRLTTHPLASIPGPFSLRLTSLPLLWRSYAGTEARYLTSLFLHHSSSAAVAATTTPILRIGPDEVLLADGGGALAPIYSASGGFAKAACYRNFDIEGFPSLFSALDRAHRVPRARSVMPLFAAGALRGDKEAAVRGVAGRLVRRLALLRERARGERSAAVGRVDVLDPARRAAVDVVSACLFGRSYGGLGEVAGAAGGEDEEGKLSASGFVNAFVGVGRFFFLPNWAFLIVEKVAGYLLETKETAKSFESVAAFVERLVEEADVEDGTYQARLLKLGLSKKEVAAQMKDLVFAGTDSSGMNLSTFCWQMAKHPDIYAKAKAEVLEARRENAGYDPSALPYLRACLKETLRLSMANPTRLPRVVPKEGWMYVPSADFSFSTSQATGKAQEEQKNKNDDKEKRPAYYLPPGTIVSVQIHTLHHNPAVFPRPYEFKPERWLESPPALLDRMNRDHIPFSLGSRGCIARNLAMMELNVTSAAVLESGLLDRARAVGERIEILEWFNSKVRGERIEIEYPPA